MEILEAVNPAATSTYQARRRLRVAPELIFSLLWLVLGILWICLLPREARLDMDEGINLMKARLLGDGYKLYRDIWSDQPPLFAYLLQGWWRIFGDSVTASRSLVMVFSAIAILAAGRITRWLCKDPWAGLIAMALILGGRHYAKLSMAVMIGLPAISLALVGAWLVIEAADRRWRIPGYALAGALTAAGLQTKLFAFILLPMIVVLMILAHQRARTTRSQQLWTSVAFLLSFFAVFLPLTPFYQANWQDQLILPHVRDHRPDDEPRSATAIGLLNRLAEDGQLVLLAGLGITLAWHARKQMLAPIVWLLVSLAVLSQANPIWGHHRLMLSFPLSMIAAIGLCDVVRAHDHRWVQRLAGLLLIAACVFGVVRVILAIPQTGTSDIPQTREMLGAVAQRSAPGGWIVTDDPFIACQSRLRVPPNLAVMSKKRLNARQLSETEILQTIDRYEPRLLLFARFKLSHEFDEQVRRKYRSIVIQQEGGHLLERANH